MTEELIVSGFGGQGVLSLGMTLAYAAMIEGKEVSWMPSYGPEMRGGTANCITILADAAISSPIVSAFDTAILLNQPSVQKFSGKLKNAGLLIYESDTVRELPLRRDIELIGIPATREALKLGNGRFMNMIILGAYLHVRPVVEVDSVLAALAQVLPKKYHHTLELNERALLCGEELAYDIRQGVMMVC